MTFRKSRGNRITHDTSRSSETFHRVGASVLKNLRFLDSGALKRLQKRKMFLNYKIHRRKTDGKIVTYSMSELDPRRAAIIDLWVHQPHREKGIGSILLDAALSRLLEKGFEKVELVTDPSKNPVAHNMYRGRGFRVVAEWCSYQKKLESRM